MFAIRISEKLLDVLNAGIAFVLGLLRLRIFQHDVPLQLGKLPLPGFDRQADKLAVIGELLEVGEADRFVRTRKRLRVSDDRVVVCTTSLERWCDLRQWLTR